MMRHEQQVAKIRAFSWAASIGFMLLLYLVLGVLHVRQPRQEDVPQEALLRWVRTIVPTSPQERLRRVRVRERISARMPSVEARQLEESRARLPVRVRDTAAAPDPARADNRESTLPRREDATRRIALPDMSGRWDDGASLEGREGSRLDLGGDGPATDLRESARTTSREGGLEAFRRVPLEAVYRRFLGCDAASYPSGELNASGRSMRFWICDEGELRRVLLQDGDELHLLVITPDGSALQSYRRGVAERVGGETVVRSSFVTLDQGEVYRQAIAAVLEPR